MKRDVGMACKKVRGQGRIKVIVNIQSPFPTSLLLWKDVGMDEALYIYYHFYPSLICPCTFLHAFLHLFSFLMIFLSCHIFVSSPIIYTFTFSNSNYCMRKRTFPVSTRGGQSDWCSGKTRRRGKWPLVYTHSLNTWLIVILYTNCANLSQLHC